MRIRFGTSGWRGIIAREFTWDRVDTVVDAVASYLRQKNRHTIVVGGDCRFLSPELSRHAAERLCGYGFRVGLSTVPCPTPVLSHACIREGMGGVINFTASHNPPLYNGIKFNPWHGGPAGNDVTREIEELAAAHPVPEQGEGSIDEIDFRGEYVEALKELLDDDVFRDSGLRVVYDAFSGTGSGILDKMLVDLGAAVRVMNGVRDPLFAGREHPDPGREGTRDLSSQVVASGASLGVATDGDADRFGLVDEKGVFVSPNDYFPALLDYLAGHKGMKGKVVRSVTTSSLVDRVAEYYGLETVVTPVGFKYLGAEMLAGDVLLACEESGGLSIGGHVPEKDGILACLLACEMMCSTGKSMSQLLEDVWKRFGRSHVVREDIVLKGDLREKMTEIFIESHPRLPGGTSVVSVDRMDGVRMILENGDWVLVRLSGTEPLARVYAHSGSPGRARLLANEVRDMLVNSGEGPR